MPTPIPPATGAPEMVLAKDQPMYQPLPVAVYQDTGLATDIYVSRWTLTPQERLAIAEGEDIYVSQMLFGHNYPPVGVHVGPSYFALPGGA